MTKRTKAATKDSYVKTEKKESKSRPTKEYYEKNGISDIVLTQAQKECQNQIRANTLTFVEGPAGTGKSACVLHWMVQQYLQDKSKQLIVIRTPVEAGKDRLGFMPGTYEEKAAVHFDSTKRLLGELMTPNKVECDLGKRIHFLVPNYALGATYDNALIYINEAQQLEPMILKLLLERTGKYSKVVVDGDRSQLYTTDRNRNALTDALGRFFDSPGFPAYPDIGYYKFSIEDVMRSDIVKTVIRAYSQEE